MVICQDEIFKVTFFENNVKFAITFEWSVIELSYFTFVFLVRLFLLSQCQGYLSRSRSNIKVKFFGKWLLVFHKHSFFDIEFSMRFMHFTARLLYEHAVHLCNCFQFWPSLSICFWIKV